MDNPSCKAKSDVWGKFESAVDDTLSLNVSQAVCLIGETWSGDVGHGGFDLEKILGNRLVPVLRFTA